MFNFWWVGYKCCVHQVMGLCLFFFLINKYKLINWSQEKSGSIWSLSHIVVHVNLTGYSAYQNSKNDKW